MGTCDTDASNYCEKGVISEEKLDSLGDCGDGALGEISDACVASTLVVENGEKIEVVNNIDGAVYTDSKQDGQDSLEFDIEEDQDEQDGLEFDLEEDEDEQDDLEFDLEEQDDPNISLEDDKEDLEFDLEEDEDEPGELEFDLEEDEDEDEPNISLDEPDGLEFDLEEDRDGQDNLELDIEKDGEQDNLELDLEKDDEQDGLEFDLEEDEDEPEDLNISLKEDQDEQENLIDCMDKPVDTDNKNSLPAVETEYSRDSSEAVKNKDTQFKSNSIPKKQPEDDNSYIIIKNKKPVRKLSKQEKYATLTNERLMVYVTKFLTVHGVSAKPVNRRLLDDEFGR